MKLKITICLLIVTFSIILGAYQFVIFNDKKLHVIFCDVGQGDAIFLRAPNGADILVDGGPNNNNVIDCLHKYMPFWDQTIEVVMLSHPHSDHYTGLIEVAKDYHIDRFVTEDLSNKTKGYDTLKKILQENNIPIQHVYKGDRFKIGELTISILAPTKEFIAETSPGGFVGESSEFASVIPFFSFFDTKILLTGDTQSRELTDAIKATNLGNITVLQVPHHGSKTGLSQEIVDLLHPHLSVIFVGAKNRYHHPAPATVNLLQKNNLEFKMTKDSGDIEIVSDGKNVSFSN